MVWQVWYNNWEIIDFEGTRYWRKITKDEVLLSAGEQGLDPIINFMADPVFLTLYENQDKRIVLHGT